MKSKAVDTLTEIMKNKYKIRNRILEQGGNTKKVDEELEDLLRMYYDLRDDFEKQGQIVKKYKEMAERGMQVKLVDEEINFGINKEFNQGKALKKIADELIYQLKSIKEINKYIKNG